MDLLAQLLSASALIQRISYRLNLKLPMRIGMLYVQENHSLDINVQIMLK